MQIDLWDDSSGLMMGGDNGKKIASIIDIFCYIYNRSSEFVLMVVVLVNEWGNVVTSIPIDGANS